MKRPRRCLAGLIPVAAMAVLAACGRVPADTLESGVSLELAAPGAPPAFVRATGPSSYSFPEDHGPHLGFQTEWWYYTGNLETPEGDRLAYQLTFFRRGLAVPGGLRPSRLAADQIYFAHFAITDVRGARHPHWERFSRGAAGLAGAAGSPYGVWLDDWSVSSLDPAGDSVRLFAREQDWELDLTLQSEKGVVAHGDGGLSPKSGEAGNASYYLSLTRLRTQGTVTLAGSRVEVAGSSWFDHEWSTSALGAQAIGWDWFSLQMDDGTELMLFQIRRSDGSLEPVSSGTLVEADGTLASLTGTDFTIEANDSWRSPETGATYPTEWVVRVPGFALELSVRPILDDQEMRVSFPYWEGAVTLDGTRQGRPLQGRGFVELTGYARSMQGVF